MNEFQFPWFEAAMTLPLVGALWMSVTKQRTQAFGASVLITSLTLLVTVAGMISFLNLVGNSSIGRVTSVRSTLVPTVFGWDGVSAVLLPLAATVFWVVTLTTLRTKMSRFSFTLALVSESLTLAICSCHASWTLVALLALAALLPYFEMRQRGAHTLVYVVHMSLFVGFLLIGWGWLQLTVPRSNVAVAPMLLVLAAVLIRSGMLPMHLWVRDLFDKASFGTAILVTTPLIGPYLVIRFVLGDAPAWAVQIIVIAALVTAVYASGMALVQREARRLFAYVLTSQVSLVLVGLALSTPLSTTGALCIWISAGLSLTGFGVTLRSVESRIARISLTEYHGLSHQMPMVAGFFLLTGLASIGFPATAGYVGLELLLEGALNVSVFLGSLIVLATALTSIAVLMAYFRIFTGRTYPTTIPMRARTEEAIAILTLSGLILAGGMWPQPCVLWRYQTAEDVTNARPVEAFAAGSSLAYSSGFHSQQPIVRYPWQRR